MEILITGKHDPVHPRVSDYARSRFGRLAKYMKTIDKVTVEMYRDGKGGNSHVVTVKVTAGRPLFRTKATGRSHRACVDTAVATLEREIVEFKRKRRLKPGIRRAPFESS